MDQQPASQNLQQCPDCRAIIPAGTPRCPYCEADQVEPAPLDPEAARERAFLLALYTRSNPFTYIFIGVNVGVFALMWLAGGMSAMSADPDVLVGFGAKVNNLIRNNGEYWRFVTSMFIHIGFIHLFLNNYALYIVGAEIERLYGSSRFVLLYLLAGLCGSLASYLYTENTSAGASGAIFGLFGVLAAFAFRYRREVPKDIRDSIKKRVIPLILLNLVIGFSARQIDNAAHIGGLVSGLALGFVIPYKRPRETSSTLVWRALRWVSLAIIFGSIFIAAQRYDGPPLSLANLASNPQAARASYYEGMSEGYNSMVESSRAFQELIDGGPDDASRRALDASERAVRAVREAPALRGKPGELRETLLALVSDQKALVEQYARAKSIDRGKAIAEQNAIVLRANRFFREFETWASGE